MRQNLVLVLVLFISFLSARSAFALEDGFNGLKRIEGEHFSILLSEGVDMEVLLNELKISPTDEQLTNTRIDHSSPEKQLASMVEVMFNRAGDILDMHVYSLKGSIKVFADHEKLDTFYRQLFNTSLPCTGLSFYLPDNGSIYISATAFRREVLGHEIGHAIMSRYFVVQPSVKVQEVLAGYVEYSLRKSK